MCTSQTGCSVFHATLLVTRSSLHQLRLLGSQRLLRRTALVAHGCCSLGAGIVQLLCPRPIPLIRLIVLKNGSRRGARHVLRKRHVVFLKAGTCHSTRRAVSFPASLSYSSHMLAYETMLWVPFPSQCCCAYVAYALIDRSCLLLLHQSVPRRLLRCRNFHSPPPT